MTLSSLSLPLVQAEGEDVSHHKIPVYCDDTPSMVCQTHNLEQAVTDISC